MNARKLLMLVYIVFVCILAASVIALSFRVIPLDMIINTVSMIYNNFYYLTIIVLVCILLIAAGIRIIVMTFGKNRYSPSITTYNEHGIIKISIETIKNLSLKAASQVNGVRDVKSQIIVKQDDGLYVNIGMRVIPEADIPLISSNVQTKVKEYIEKYIGATVKEVRIYVKDIFNSAARVE